MDHIDISNDQEQISMTEVKASISYQLGSYTFIKAGFLADEKIPIINGFHLNNDGLASFFQNNKYPIINKIFQSLQYRGRGFGLHEKGILEPIQFCVNLRHQGLGYSLSRKSNDVSDTSTILGVTLSNTNIKIGVMSSYYHKVVANTHSIHTINHHSQFI